MRSLFEQVENLEANVVSLRSELLWAVYGFIQALENTRNRAYLELAQKWQGWMDYTKTTGAKVSLQILKFSPRPLAH